jgi:uncharacterized phage-associated protein
MYSVFDIAKYIIKKCNDERHIITNLKLQKILYYIQGYFLRGFGKPAFFESIYAWPYGPVVPDIYFRYNIYRASNIIDNDNNMNYHFDLKEQAYIDKIIDRCISMSANELVEQTHREDPWRKTVSSDLIYRELIEQYFCNNDPLVLGV